MNRRSEAAQAAWDRRKAEGTRRHLEKLGQAPRNEREDRLWAENLAHANRRPAPVDDNELDALLDELGLGD